MGNVWAADKKIIASRQPRHLNRRATRFYKGDQKVVEDDRFVKVIEGVRRDSKRQKGDPDRYFIKTVKSKKHVTKERFEYIKQDMEVLCALNHPNIIKYYALCGNYKKFHVIMEYWPGKTLKQYRLDSPANFSERDAAVIGKQLLSAISYWNAEQITHRNLTPENILIGEGLQIKIINFEQSKLKYQEMNLQKKDGASSFTAPEWFRNEFSQKCDVWSIGVILYLLISGIDPFSGDDLMQKFKRSEGCLASFTPRAWRKISDDWKDLITKMLIGDPMKRITVDQALGHKWFDKFDNESTTY